MAKETQIWQFSYHKGQAHLQGYCRASTETLALAVATRWCEKENCRPPAAVRPWILADESILSEPDPNIPEEIPMSVSA